MANRLTKDFAYTYIPGSPGVPAVAAVPYQPAYTTYELISYAGCGGIVPAYNTSYPRCSYCYGVPQVYCTRYEIVAGQQVCVAVAAYDPCYAIGAVYDYVYHPAVPAVAAVAAIPPTPAQVIVSNNQGWNAGAISGPFLGSGVDGGFRFEIFPGSAAAVVGLATYNTRVTINDVKFGFYWANGVLSVVENGNIRASGYAYAKGQELSIRRDGTIVTYWVNGVLVRTSGATSTGDVFLDAHLYQAGDYVEDPDLFYIHDLSGSITSTTTAKLSRDLRGYFTSRVTTYASIRKNLEVDLAGSITSTALVEAAILNDVALSGSITSTAMVTAGLAANGAVLSMMPASGFAGTGFHAEAEMTFEPMVVEAYASMLQPTVTGANLVLYPTSGYAHGLTGELSWMEEGSFLPIEGMSSGHKDSDPVYRYAEATMTMQPLQLSSVSLARMDIDIRSTLLYFPNDMIETELYIVLSSDVEYATVLSVVRSPEADTSSTVTYTDSIAMQGEYNLNMVQILQLLSDAGVVDSEAAVWALNRATGSSFRYTNYDFTQYMTIGEFTYGVKSDGVYLLGRAGTDDGAEIKAYIDFGKINFGTTRHKALLHAYLGVQSDGELRLRVVDDTGKEYMYAARASEELNTVRVDTGRGLSANYYQLQLYNDAGADFELADVEFYATPMTRRI